MNGALKSLFKALLMGVDTIPQFVAIDALATQEEIRITLEGMEGMEEIGPTRDVTRNCVVASLRPLLFAIGFPDGLDAAALAEARPWLTISSQVAPCCELGRIRLRFARSIDLRKMPLALFASTGHANYCLSPLRQRLYSLYQWQQLRRNRNPYNFRMTPADLHSLSLFYIRTRPVVLVTVVCGDQSNIFPMDLIGPVAGPYFLMALRSTSPAVALMTQSRRIALSSMSQDHTQTIYDLGKHHRLERIDWESLPFKTVPTPLFGLPVPAVAHHVEEREIVATHPVGSHVLFITSCTRTTEFAAGGQMGHRVGFYHDYLQRRGMLRPRPELRA